VPVALRERGIASALTDYALRYARDENLRVIPSCPFVAAFVRRHPEHEPVLRRG
jgi:predicted GNAT family acetyltransferase